MIQESWIFDYDTSATRKVEESNNERLVSWKVKIKSSTSETTFSF